VQRKDGRFMASIRLGTDGDGKPIRKSFYGATKKEVADKLAEFRKERSLRAWGTPSEMTVEELADDWLTTCHSDKSLATLANREDIVRLHITPHIGHIKVQQLAPMHVHRMLEARGGEGASAQNKVYEVLNNMLRYALRMQLILSNPAAVILKPRVVRKEMPIYDSEQVKQILRAAAGKRLAALFTVACCTGMRQGELLGLHWDAVDLEAGVLHVRQTLLQVRSTLKLKEPKSKAGRRTITLPPLAVVALHEHRKAMLKEGRDVRKGLVFCGRTGSFIRRTNLIRCVWKPTLKTAGVPEQPFHSLRHSHASELLRNGQSIVAVARRLGHSTPAMTLRVYAHVLPHEDNRLSECIQTLYA
jgi:integrase